MTTSGLITFQLCDPPHDVSLAVRRGVGEERHKYKLSCYAIAEIVCNDLMTERRKVRDWQFLMNVRIAAQSDLRRGANSLHSSTSKGIRKREVKATGPTENPIKPCILKNHVYLLLGFSFPFYDILAQLIARDSVQQKFMQNCALEIIL